MKATTYALLVRNKVTNEVFDVQPMSSENDTVCVTYPNKLIGSMESLHAAIKGYNEAVRKDCYFKYSEGEDICLESEAIYALNMGNVELEVVCKEVDWSNQLPEAPTKLNKYEVSGCIEMGAFEDGSKLARKAEGSELPSFYTVYENHEDGTQTAVVDKEDKVSADNMCQALNGGLPVAYATSTFVNQMIKINWDYDVLAVTPIAVLLYLKEGKEEYVVYSHTNQGSVYQGFYTKVKTKAMKEFIKRAGLK